MTIRIQNLPQAAALGPATDIVVRDPAAAEADRVARAPLQVLADALPRRVASLFVSGNTTATVISTTQTYVAVAADGATVTTIEARDFTRSGVVWTYTGSAPRWCMVWCTACVTMTDQNNEVRLRLTLDGSDLPQTCARTSLTGTPGSGRAANLSTHTLLLLQPGEAVGVVLANWTGTQDITLRNMQLSLLEV